VREGETRWKKFWCGTTYARPIDGFKGAASRRGGAKRREGRGTEREKRGRRKGGKSWNRAADWLRPALLASERKRNKKREMFFPYNDQ